MNQPPFSPFHPLQTRLPKSKFLAAEIYFFSGLRGNGDSLGVTWSVYQTCLDLHLSEVLVSPHQSHELLPFLAFEHKLTPHHPRHAVVNRRLPLQEANNSTPSGLIASKSSSTSPSRCQGAMSLGLAIHENHSKEHLFIKVRFAFTGLTILVKLALLIQHVFWASVASSHPPVAGVL